MSVNKVILLGNVGREPEVRYVAQNQPMATFSLATTEHAFTNANGVQVPERTEWHNIVMWGRNAEVAERMCTRARNSTSKAVCAPAHGKTATKSSVMSPRCMSTRLSCWVARAVPRSNNPRSSRNNPRRSRSSRNNSFYSCYSGMKIKVFSRNFFPSIASNGQNEPAKGRR